MRMPNRLEEMLNDLDALIAEYSLHSGDPLVPVRIDPLLERGALISWLYMPEPCHAVSVRVGTECGIAFNRDLCEPELSHQARRAKGHEFGHMFRRHAGYSVLWRFDGSRDDPFERYLRTTAEREAEVAAAYLLVSRASLHALRGHDLAYIAGVLDVCEHLVALRYEILRKYKR